MYARQCTLNRHRRERGSPCHPGCTASASRAMGCQATQLQRTWTLQHRAHLCQRLLNCNHACVGCILCCFIFVVKDVCGSRVLRPLALAHDGCLPQLLLLLVNVHTLLETAAASADTYALMGLCATADDLLLSALHTYCLRNCPNRQRPVQVLTVCSWCSIGQGAYPI